MTYETRKLTEIEFPMYFSLVPNPGYNISFLKTRGVGGEYELFTGQFTYENGTKWSWGSVNHTIEGKLDSPVKCIRVMNIHIF